MIDALENENFSKRVDAKEAKDVSDKVEIQAMFLKQEKIAYRRYCL